MTMPEMTKNNKGIDGMTLWILSIILKNGTRIETNENDDKIYVMDGHPNHIITNMSIIDGRLHKEDGPAIELINGTKIWYNNNEIHREDGPAIEWASGDKYWYSNGVLHRDGGPAIEWANGDRYWYKNGKRHREDGPAIQLVSGGIEAYYLNDLLYHKEEYSKKLMIKSDAERAE